MLIVQGSARSNGNTRKIAEFIHANAQVDIIDLAALDIGQFSYEGPLKDDFTKVIDIIIKHDDIIFLTPIYWYTMSGKMKVFLDRITELLKWNKDKGRKLRGKNICLVSSSMHDDAPEHFAYPFEMSAEYLGMNFKGYCHTWIEEGKVSDLSQSRLTEMIDLL